MSGLLDGVGIIQVRGIENVLDGANKVDRVIALRVDGIPLYVGSYDERGAAMCVYVVGTIL